MKKLLLILFIALFISCKKEDKYQTIYPLPYLPVYPGSNWKYINQNGDTILQVTDPDYKLDSYTYDFGTLGSTNEAGVYLTTDPVYVPVWNGMPVYGYSHPGSDYFSGDCFYQIGFLSETLGQSWGFGDSKFYKHDRQVVNTDTTLVLNSITYHQVIKVSQHGYTWYPTSVTIWEEDNYFAKDIGLVYQVSLTDTLELISYYINR